MRWIIAFILLSAIFSETSGKEVKMRKQVWPDLFRLSGRIFKKITVDIPTLFEQRNHSVAKGKSAQKRLTYQEALHAVSSNNGRCYR